MGAGDMYIIQPLVETRGIRYYDCPSLGHMSTLMMEWVPQKFYQKENRQEFYSSNMMTNNYFEPYSLYGKDKGVRWSVTLGILTKESRHGGYQIPK